MIFGAPIAVVIGAFVLLFFQPQKLFIDERVDDTEVTSASTDEGGTAPAAGGKEPVKPDGTAVLRLGTSVRPTGRICVYLSAGSNDASFGREYGRDFVELGKLKGNICNQNYEIPAGTDLSRYRNAVIWCKRFNVGFGVATLD